LLFAPNAAYPYYVIRENEMTRRTTITLILMAMAIVSGCSSWRLNLEPINKNYGLLSYESGAMIATVSEETKSQMMKSYCAPRGYEIVEIEGKTVGQYRFITKVQFKCTVSKEN